MNMSMDTFLETRQRMSLEEQSVRNFAEGYLDGVLACNANLYEWDDWVVWNKYDINFVGRDYTSEELGEKGLLVVVYPRDWMDALPDHLYSFVVSTSVKLADNLPLRLSEALKKGESK